MKKVLAVSSFMAIIAGILLFGGGIYGFVLTYKNVAQENIITHKDAAMPNVPVRGPFTLKAQADVIRLHVLRATEGKTYAEMPREVRKLDQRGNTILDQNGEQVMVENTARDIWITATTLINSLDIAILAYALSAISLLSGLVSVCIGAALLILGKKLGENVVEYSPYEI